MKFTKDNKVLKNLLNQNVPVEVDDVKHDKVVIYIQDVTNYIDYYIISRSPESDEFLALVHPLQTNNVLELEHVPLSFLKGSRMFYKVFPTAKQYSWKKKYKEILPIKYGIPSKHNS